MKQITARTLVIGISNDILFPIDEQEFLADTITDASFKTLNPFTVMMGFLLEYDKITKQFNNFCNSIPEKEVKQQLIK